MEIYLCRHGETEWSLSGQHTSRTDLGLTEVGKKQAMALGKRLQGISFDFVFSSPMKRALETCSQAHLQPQIDPDLCEWDYGEYEGLTYAQIEARNPGWDLFIHGAPQGESPAAVTQRADRFLSRLSSPGRIAIFGHGHFSRVLAMRWLGLEAKVGRLFLFNEAALSILSVERHARVLSLWNDSRY